MVDIVGLRGRTMAAGNVKINVLKEIGDMTYSPRISLVSSRASSCLWSADASSSPGKAGISAPTSDDSASLTLDIVLIP